MRSWSDEDRARRTQIREPSARLTGRLDHLSDGIDGYLGMFAFVEKLRMGCALATSTASRVTWLRRPRSSAYQ